GSPRIRLSLRCLRSAWDHLPEVLDRPASVMQDAGHQLDAVVDLDVLAHRHLPEEPAAAIDADGDHLRDVGAWIDAIAGPCDHGAKRMLAACAASRKRRG